MGSLNSGIEFLIKTYFLFGGYLLKPGFNEKVSRKQRVYIKQL